MNTAIEARARRGRPGGTGVNGGGGLGRGCPTGFFFAFFLIFLFVFVLGVAATLGFVCTELSRVLERGFITTLEGARPAFALVAF